MSLPDDLKSMPGLAIEDDEPVFTEPWQAQAFAMVIKLHENGHFTWVEWAETLGAEIAAAGPDDKAENYYSHWLTALEKLTQAKGIATKAEQLDRKDAWERAAKATPHGKAIVLGADLLAHNEHHDH